MLPDYPDVKAAVSRRLNLFLRRRAQMHRGGALSEVRNIRMHEGDTSGVVQEDGAKRETNFRETSAEVVITAAELPNLKFSDLLERLDRVAKSLGEQQAKLVFEDIAAAVKGKENEIDMKGEKFSSETMMRAIKAIRLDFDEKGNPIMPTMVIGAGMVPIIEAAQKQFDGDADAQRRWKALLADKRDEWRAREADRNLVG